MNRERWITIARVFAVPTGYALFLRFVYGVRSWNEVFEVMSITFLFSLPTVIGALTVYLSGYEQVRQMGYRILAPWISVVAFFVLTLIFSLEGWACWVMVLPIYLFTSSIGGLIGGYLKMRKLGEQSKFYISFLVLLPLVLSPLESLIEKIPGTYEAYTFIDIQAPAEKIWNNVTRVKAIDESQDKGWLSQSLGLPRPVKAELNFEGQGGYREAIFTKGLVFHETVLDYKDEEKMVFSIKADPHDIPSTTMDEHIVIGGDYFDVLNGTYELKQIDANTFRLHLYSHFKLTTTFNFYAGWWAKWIMKDIQNNILQVIKARAENE